MTEKFTLEEFLAPENGKTISYYPWDKDDNGLLLKPGERCRVTMRQPGYPMVSFLADRALGQSILDFLDKIKEETDAEAHEA